MINKRIYALKETVLLDCFSFEAKMINKEINAVKG
jgi:hypothetical protein